MVYAQPRICPREWKAQTPLGFWETNGSPNLGQRARSYNDQQEKKKKKKKKRELAELWTTEWNWKNGKDGLVPRLSWRIEKAVEHESDGDTSCNWCSWHSHQRISTKTGGLENNRTSGDHPNYCIIEIGQNIEKSLGDLKWLDVTQTPMRNHQLTLV